MKTIFSFLAFQIFSIFPLLAILDTNANGLSDVWEKQYNTSQLFNGSNPTHAATADPDQDGWTNAQEALAGTDPFSANGPNGKTALVIQQTSTAATYELTWPVIPGKNYRIQASTNLHFWFNIGQPIPTDSYATFHTISIQAEDPENTNVNVPPPKLFYRIKVLDRDEDSDLLTTTEEWALGTSAWNNDSDYDSLPDRWEILHQFNPTNFFENDADADPDNDGLVNRYEFLLGHHPLEFTNNATTYDRDGDGMPDLFEAETAVYQWHSQLYQSLYIRKLDWDVADGQLDFDKDTLTNISEYTISTTDPVYWDTDLDMLPDAWEISQTLDPKNNSGNHGAQGDLDGDGLSNIDEYTHGTKANNPDSDGDGVNDKIEVDQGSDPNKNADNGQAPTPYQLIDVLFRMGDPSESKSEIWKMTIQGTGPDDTRKIELVSPNYGEMANKMVKLRKWNQYTITMQHVSTEKNKQTDYDWAAQVDAQPLSTSIPESATEGANNYFTVKNHWIMDNRQAVFTLEKQGDEQDLVSGKAAYLVPIQIHDVGNTAKLGPTGIDDVSLTADPASLGYQSDFWIMSPLGGAPKNTSYFRIPLDPPVNLTITGTNTTAHPNSVTLSKDSLTSEIPRVEWEGIGTEGESNISFQIGPHLQNISLPIKAKNMKKRTVKVAIYPVRRSTAHRNVPMPDLVQLQIWLNLVFYRQLNAQFEVTYMPQTEYEYMSADGEYGYLTSTHSTNTFRAMFASTAYAPGPNDIRILMIDYAAIALTQLPPPHTLPSGLQIVGLVDRSNNGAIVLAGRAKATDNDRTPEAVIRTIAHEIGHVIVGEGHPDGTHIESDPTSRGVAPLDGTEHQYRLMCSGFARKPDAKLLVKAEWDAALTWLIGRSNGDK